MSTPGVSRLRRKKSANCVRSRRNRRWGIVPILLLFPAQAQKQPDITEAWDQLLGNTAAPAPPAAEAHGRDFIDRFYLESRSQFTRQQIGFTGQPTITGFTDAL